MDEKEWKVGEMAKALAARFDRQAKWDWPLVAERIFWDHRVDIREPGVGNGVKLTPTIVAEALGLKHRKTALMLIRNLVRKGCLIPIVGGEPYRYRSPPRDSPWVFISWKWHHNRKNGQEQDHKPAAPVKLSLAPPLPPPSDVEVTSPAPASPLPSPPEAPVDVKKRLTEMRQRPKTPQTRGK